MSSARFEIRNTTVKPPKIDRKSGKDTRTTREKRGFLVQWRDSSGQTYTIAPGANQRPRFVNEVSEGLLRLKEGKLVSITEIQGGVAAQMKQHTLGAARQVSSTQNRAAVNQARKESQAMDQDLAPSPLEAAPAAVPPPQAADAGEPAGEAQPPALDPEETPASNQEQADAAAAAAHDGKASAVEMGQDDHGEGKEGDGTGYEGAVNPDGPDKHTVVAPSAASKKKTASRKKSSRRKS